MEGQWQVVRTPRPRPEEDWIIIHNTTDSPRNLRRPPTPSELAEVEMQNRRDFCRALARWRR